MRAATVERGRKVRGGSRMISLHDLEILRFIGEQYLVDQEQLTRLRKRSPNTDWRWRRKYQQAGLIFSRQLLPNQVFVWLTQKGLDQAGLNYRYVEPAVGRIEHTVAVGDVRLAVEARLKEQGREGYVWVSERQLAKELPKGEHMPDGEVLLADGRTAAIEVELTLKRKPRMTDIFLRLLCSYSAVWAWCTDAPRRQLEAIVEENGWQKVQIIDFP